MSRIVNQQELAELLDVSHTTLWNWHAEGLPAMRRGARGESNEFDTKQVIDWLIEREVKKVRSLSPRDEGIQLDNELKKRALAEKDHLLVPAAGVEPVWLGRVLAAAAFLSNAHSRLAGLLEAAPGIEGKREILRSAFHQFLVHLGVNGELIQSEVERLLASLPAEQAADFMRRIGADVTPLPAVESDHMESAR